MRGFYRGEHIFTPQMLYKSAHLPLSNFHGCGRASRRAGELRNKCMTPVMHRRSGGGQWGILHVIELTNDENEEEGDRGQADDHHLREETDAV